jgi:hypothetical protein
MDPRDLRGIVYRADVSALFQGLQDPAGWPEHSLQLVGDGLVSALVTEEPGAEDLAHRCRDALRERDWAGDAELAATLGALLNDGPAPFLRQLPVDLEELASILEGDPVEGGGRVSRTTGEVWPQAAVDYGIEVGDIDPDDEDDRQWLWVESEGSHEGYRDMELFIALLDDDHLAERLTVAIQGRGAFRRFTDTLGQDPEQLGRWLALSSDRRRGRARAWLARHRYTPSPLLPA